MSLMTQLGLKDTETKTGHTSPRSKTPAYNNNKEYFNFTDLTDRQPS
jgi:hypothetical protein